MLYEDDDVCDLKQAYEDFISAHGTAPTLMVVSNSVVYEFEKEILRYDSYDNDSQTVFGGVQIVKTPRKDITIRLY